jgi:hypothetical protein
LVERKVELLVVLKVVCSGTEKAAKSVAQLDFSTVGMMGGVMALTLADQLEK